VKTTTDYWKRWWNGRGRQDSANYEVDRGTICIDAVEHRNTQELLISLAPQPTDLLLDVGCGSGANISKLRSRVAYITGMDFSQEMLKRAGERVSAEAITNASLVIGDVTNMPFPDQSYDKILCASVLQYLNDDECVKAIHEMKRVCRPGGRIVLHVKNSTSLYGISLMALRRVARLIGRPTRPGIYRPRRWYLQTLTRDGIQVIADYGFGVFTFVPLSRIIVRWLLQAELHLLRGPAFRRFGVNYSITAMVPRSGSPVPGSEVNSYRTRTA